MRKIYNRKCIEYIEADNYIIGTTTMYIIYHTISLFLQPPMLKVVILFLMFFVFFLILKVAANETTIMH